MSKWPCGYITCMHMYSVDVLCKSFRASSDLSIKHSRSTSVCMSAVFQLLHALQMHVKIEALYTKPLCQMGVAALIFPSFPGSEFVQ